MKADLMTTAEFKALKTLPHSTIPNTQDWKDVEKLLQIAIETRMFHPDTICNLVKVRAYLNRHMI